MFSGQNLAGGRRSLAGCREGCLVPSLPVITLSMCVHFHTCVCAFSHMCGCMHKLVHTPVEAGSWYQVFFPSLPFQELGVYILCLWMCVDSVTMLMGHDRSGIAPTLVQRF